MLPHGFVQILGLRVRLNDIFTRGIGRSPLFLKSVFFLCGGAPFSLLLVALLARPSVAQAPAVGTEATLDVATWNVEWFGADGQGPADEALQFENVRQAIAGSEIDLWALQEITDAATFGRLLDSLGTAYDGVLATESGSQRIAFVYRTAVVHRRRADHILEDQYSYEFAGRPPLQLDATVTLPDTTLAISFVVLHMKCCGGAGDYDRRKEAATRLKGRLDILYPADAYIILGDFNDELSRSIAGGRPSPYTNFLEDPEAYRFTTAALEQAGEHTYCSNSACSSGSFLDHILITDELFTAYEEGSTARYDALLSSFDNYPNTTSDHLPVYARFRFARSTAVEAGNLPVAASLEAVYPNPFRMRTSIRYHLAQPGVVSLEVFDVLGRRYPLMAPRVQGAGKHEWTWAPSLLSPGLYVVRLHAGGRSFVRPVLLQP